MEQGAKINTCPPIRGPLQLVQSPGVSFAGSDIQDPPLPFISPPSFRPVFPCAFCSVPQAGSISRADVADFLIGAISDEDFPYLKQAPCISSVGGTSWVKDRSKAARGEMA